MHFLSSSSLPLIEGIIVFLLTAVNLALCAREERLRRTEMVRSAQDLLSNCDGKEQALVEDLMLFLFLGGKLLTALYFLVILLTP